MELAARITLKRILHATADEAQLPPERVRSPGRGAGRAVKARQRAIMLMRHLRPDQSWPAIAMRFGMDHSGAFEAAGAAATRWQSGDLAERNAVEAICRSLEVEVGEIDLAASRRRHLRRTLGRAQVRAAALELQLAELEQQP